MSAAESASEAEAELPPYGEAVIELERILNELESSTVDVDVLTDRVARANTLIKYCQDRLDAVRADVNEVLADGAAGGRSADA